MGAGDSPNAKRETRLGDAMFDNTNIIIATLIPTIHFLFVTMDSSSSVATKKKLKRLCV